MDNKEIVVLAGQGKSSGGEVTPASIVTATGQMDATQKTQTRTNIGAASSAEQANLIGRVSNLEGRNIPVTGSDPTITPSAFGIYNCGTLTSLTITNPPATGSYSIVFTSGATATTTNIPSSILGLESFAAEANTTYEINVLDNRAVVGSWAVRST